MFCCAVLFCLLHFKFLAFLLVLEIIPYVANLNLHGTGQVGAIQLGISRALQSWEPDLRPPLRSGTTYASMVITIISLLSSVSAIMLFLVIGLGKSNMGVIVPGRCLSLPLKYFQN